MEEKKYWFRRKRYGWGWTPQTWEGWVSMMVYIALLVGNAHRTIEAPTITPFLIQTVILTLIFLWICFQKGETPRWQWGKDDKDAYDGNT
jgi:uncharacterized membrane protein YhaH (DUF805 family)